MKANELMFGDWIQIHTEEGVFPREMTLGVFVNFYCIRDTIEPIPLTAEILEKNGILFECDGWSEKIYKSTFSYNNGPYFKKHIYITEGEDGRMTWCSDFTYKQGEPIADPVCYITYVHELQHALRLCGLTELADNFKV